MRLPIGDFGRCALIIAGSPVLVVFAQEAPLSAARPWNAPTSLTVTRESREPGKPEFELPTDKTYALGDLIDLAEARNPETRAAWQAAKARAAALGIARSDLYPTVAATAVGQTYQTGVLLYGAFAKQILGLVQAEVTLNYTLFDFGARLDRIARERSELVSANFGFNDVHRRIIFRVMGAYYQLLNANGQRRAAEVDVINAKAVEQAAGARLANGVATLPDTLEARSATAQAEYDLQSTIGSEDVASGDLATAIAATPTASLHIQTIESLQVPDHLPEPALDAIHRALEQRPDLLARLEEIRGAEAGIREARSAYYPNVAFQGAYGYLRAYGEQPPFAGSYAGSPIYNAQLNLSWTIFDGGKRRNALEEAKAIEKRAAAQADTARDQIADEVWRSYSDAKTALRQREAAAALLEASALSYRAALESYNYGVRNLLDVLSAQRALAQARSADVSARTRVLTSFADLACRTGDLLHAQAVKLRP